MSGSNVSKMRAEVIETLIGLEACIDALIGLHYLGRVSLAFYHEVLYDEYFSFGLKVRILEKILAAEGDKHRQQTEKLRRLSNIRNLFAHCGVKRYDAATKRTFVPNPRNPDEALDFDALHKEFFGTVPEVRDLLIKKAAEKGGEVKIQENGQWVDVTAPE